MRAAIILAFFTLMLLSIVVTLWLIYPRDAPWNTTSLRKVRKMLTMADVQPGEVVYDLGAGDGRVLFVAAREFGARAVGIEIDALRCLLIRAGITLRGMGDRVRIIRGNFRDQDISGADVLAFYLLERTNDDMRDTFERDLRPGTRIVSNRFPIPGWEIVDHDAGDGLFLYVVK